MQRQPCWALSYLSYMNQSQLGHKNFWLSQLLRGKSNWIVIIDLYLDQKPIQILTNELNELNLVNFNLVSIWTNLFDFDYIFIYPFKDIRLDIKPKSLAKRWHISLVLGLLTKLYAEIIMLENQFWMHKT